jgi:BolA family transcriptional regulator, general stress-responsive regulator
MLHTELESRLNKAFAPLTLVVKDESSLHAGHAGSKGGGKHFAIELRSAAFEGLTPVQRHQAVYVVVKDLMQALPVRRHGYIHALKLQLQT